MNMTLLVVDDEPNIVFTVERCLASPTLRVITATNAREGIEAVRRERPDVVLLDYRLPDQNGLDAFLEMRKIDPRLPVVIMTAYSKTDTAIEAMSRGVFEYLLKPLDLPTLQRVIAKAQEISRLQRVPAVLPEEMDTDSEAEPIIGQSTVMQEVYKTIGRIAPHDSPVLILGESGTGKELIARAIYHYSARRDAPFLAINCAALPETLLESELFGHEKGAFTGADQRRIGKFEQVNGGTIFLDEIGDMSPATQAKALRLLQDQQFERLGGNTTVKTNVRVIAATNQNLNELVQLGKFRLDLFYRLNGFTIQLPPLRDRPDDIPRLVEHFLQKFCLEMKRPRCRITPEAMSQLHQHDWPGNVRELRSTIHYALIRAPGDTLHVDDLPESCRITTSITPSQDSNYPDFFAQTQRLIASGETEVYRKLVQQFDAIILRAAWESLGGNQQQISERLGLARMTLRNKLRDCGLLPKSPESD